MIRRGLFSLSVLALLHACSNAGPEIETPPRPDACAALDSVFQSLVKLEDHLKDTAKSWNELSPELDFVVNGLKNNLESGDSNCHFLNHKIHPEVERFGFVEGLRRRVVKDTAQQGIFYLIRLRGIFSGDEEIQEFFSEEIAHVAYRNPGAYLGYLQSFPGQREMLLNTTRWSIFRQDSLMKKFGRLQGSELVTGFLEKLVPNRQDDEDL